ncbi:MAG: FAD/NAD(P)-binding oxidoreductase, partial [Candidatus Bathyarchaeia archaeon]
MGKHILILGGGFGGLAAADTLRRGLGSEHKVTLVDRQQLFFMGLTKLWVLNGTRQVGENAGNRTSLVSRGIDFLEAEVTTINTSKREVRVRQQKMSYDYLIVALGAEYSPASTRGFTEYAKNLYVESGCAEIRNLLHSF